MSTVPGPRPASIAQSRSRLPFLLGGLAALLCAQVLYGVLVLSALHKQYVKPMMAVQALTCEELGQPPRAHDPAWARPRSASNVLIRSWPPTKTRLRTPWSSWGPTVACWKDGGSPKTAFSTSQRNLAPCGETSSSSPRTEISGWHNPLKDRKGRAVGHVILGMDDQRRSEQVWQVRCGTTSVSWAASPPRRPCSWSFWP